MTQKELTKDFLQWDIKSWSKALEYWEDNIEWDKITNALELGGQMGGLSLWLALKGIQTVCSDFKDTKNKAEQFHTQFNISSFIQYQDIDATQIPYSNQFDLIVFKSIIGGIGREVGEDAQHQVFKEIYKALKPGGKLLFAENLVASPIHQQLRKRFVNWGNSWRYLTIEEMKGFLKDFSCFNIKTTGVLGTFGRNERQRHLLASIDDLVLNRICPDNWKYICYGIAEK